MRSGPGRHASAAAVRAAAVTSAAASASGEALRGLNGLFRPPRRGHRVRPSVAIRSSWNSNQNRWHESTSMPVIHAGSWPARASAPVNRS